MSAREGRRVAIATGAAAAAVIALAASIILRREYLRGPEVREVDGIRFEKGQDGELLLTFDMHDADGAALARRIGDLAGVEVIPDPGIGGRVTVCADRVPWRSALEMVAREMSCRVEADSALAGSLGVVILDAESLEHLEGTVVHPDRDRDVQLARGDPEDCLDAGVQTKNLRTLVELLLCYGKWVQLRLCHKLLLP